LCAARRPHAPNGVGAVHLDADKTNHVLYEIEEAYGWPRNRRNQSHAALRSYVTDREWEDIRSSVPRDAAALLAV
jgi:hypothetical protein